MYILQGTILPQDQVQMDPYIKNDVYFYTFVNSIRTLSFAHLAPSYAKILGSPYKFDSILFGAHSISALLHLTLVLQQHMNDFNGLLEFDHIQIVPIVFDLDLY